MPVSHLGLAVSHIPSATSFYLSALQPLGYRYIGHQGDSIGLGIESADFFITQVSNGSKTSPTHIAFSAETRLIVRECYTAALNAGGRPNGPPSYRNDDCTCFNAAVEDLDGNTIEFIYRQPHLPSSHNVTAPPERGHSHHQQNDDSDDEDVRTINSKSSRSTKLSKPTSEPEAPSAKSSVSTAVVGTLLGAAAGAAVMYAMCKTERHNAKDEAEYLSSKQSQKSTRAIEENRPPSPTAETVPASKHETNWKKSHRNFSTTESTYVSRRPSEHSAMRAIEAAPYEEDPILESISRFTAQRGEQARRQTYDAIEYMPAQQPSHTTPPSMRRAVTLPTGIDLPGYFIEAPESTTSSRHSASSRHSRRSRRDSIDDDSKLRRHDSGISMHSSRSHRERGGDAERRSSRSSTSTIKPARQTSTVLDQNSIVSESTPYDYVSTRSKSLASPRRKTTHTESAAEMPLPPSIASLAHLEPLMPSKAPSSHREARSVATTTSARMKSLPPSVASSAYQKPLPPSSVTSSPYQKSLPPSVASSPHQQPLPPSVVSSAYQKPLPPSVISSAYQKPLSPSIISSAYQKPLPPSVISSAYQKPLPPSVASSAHREPSTHYDEHSHYVSAIEMPMLGSKPSSYVSAAQVPLPSSHAGIGVMEYEDMLGDDSDGLDTIVPDDSISCVDFSKPSRQSRSSHSGRKSGSHRSSHSSKRSEAASDRTVKPAKKSSGSRHSAMTLPTRLRKEERERDDGKRSAASYS